MISGLLYNSLDANRVIKKSTTDDELIITNIILVECARHSKKKGVKFTEEEIIGRVKSLGEPIILEVAPMDELKERYYIRDDDDYAILFSVDETDTEILVTGDKDYFDPRYPVKGIRARILKPKQYLEEDSEKDGENQ